MFMFMFGVKKKDSFGMQVELFPLHKRSLPSGSEVDTNSSGSEIEINGSEMAVHTLVLFSSDCENLSMLFLTQIWITGDFGGFGESWHLYSRIPQNNAVFSLLPICRLPRKKAKRLPRRRNQREGRRAVENRPLLRHPWLLRSGLTNVLVLQLVAKI